MPLGRERSRERIAGHPDCQRANEWPWVGGTPTGAKDRQARVQITTKPSPPQASPTKASPTKASLLPNCDRVLKSVRNDIGGVAKQRDED
jgi:hypothetical protein